MKNGKLDGSFYRFNTDKYHSQPTLESMSIFENGRTVAEYELNSAGEKDGIFTQYSPDMKRIKEGRYVKNQLAEETIYNPKTNKPSVKREFGKDKKVTTYFTSDGLPMQRQTVNQNGSKVSESFDSKGNVSSITTYNAQGILIGTSKVPPPPELKKEKKVEQTYYHQEKKAGLSGILSWLADQTRRKQADSAKKKQQETQQEQQWQNEEYYRHYRSR